MKVLHCVNISIIFNLLPSIPSALKNKNAINPAFRQGRAAAFMHSADCEVDTPLRICAGGP